MRVCIGFSDRFSLIALACVSTTWCTACNRHSAVRPLDRDSNQSIVEYHQPVVPPDDKDYALHELQRGLLFFELGDYCDADERLANACRLMAQIAGDEDRETAAVLWTESSKTYRGEPYERATAFFYRGLCRYKLGDDAGALAAFRNSLACDAETRTKEQEATEDFSVSHFMAAMCYLRLGERDNAEAALRLARRHAPDNPYLDAGQLENRLVVIIAVGNGPFLRPSRLDTSIKRVDCAPCSEAKVELEVEGYPAREAALTTDLYDQAKSQEWGEMDSVRLGKSILKEVISHAPFAGMASHLVRSEADLRCWLTLPRQFYVVAVKVPAGCHTLTLRFHDANGQGLPRYDQVWFEIPISASGGDLFYFRSHPDCQNCFGMQPRKLAAIEWKE